MLSFQYNRYCNIINSSLVFSLTIKTMMQWVLLFIRVIRTVMLMPLTTTSVGIVIMSSMSLVGNCALWLLLGTAITCNQFRQKLGDGNRIHYLALDMDHLYLFANDRPKDLPEEKWKQCLGNVCNRFNSSGKEVIGFRTGNDLFRMNRKERPVQ